MRKWRNIASIFIGFVSLYRAVVAIKTTQPETLADNPIQLSLKDWKHALTETKNALKDKNLTLFAAGVGYFATLAFFPLMVALVAISALIITDQQLSDILIIVESYLPGDLAGLVSAQLENAANNQTGNILAASIAIAISLFSISSAAQNLIKATNSSYDIDETRGFIKLRLVSLGVTICIIVTILLALLLLIVNETILISFGVPAIFANIYPFLRWVLLIAIIGIALAAFYRYGPNRITPKWQWVTWGSIIATAIWTVGTVGLFVYIQYFANFSDTYSLFAGIIVLMTWLNLSALIVLLGAQINRRLESKTANSINAI